MSEFVFQRQWNHRWPVYKKNKFGKEMKTMNSLIGNIDTKDAASTEMQSKHFVEMQ